MVLIIVGSHLGFHSCCHAVRMSRLADHFPCSEEDEPASPLKAKSAIKALQTMTKRLGSESSGDSHSQTLGAGSPSSSVISGSRPPSPEMVRVRPKLHRRLFSMDSVSRLRLVPDTNAVGTNTTTEAPEERIGAEVYHKQLVADWEKALPRAPSPMLSIGSITRSPPAPPEISRASRNSYLVPSRAAPPVPVRTALVPELDLVHCGNEYWRQLAGRK